MGHVSDKNISLLIVTYRPEVNNDADPYTVSEPLAVANSRLELR